MYLTHKTYNSVLHTDFCTKNRYQSKIFRPMHDSPFDLNLALPISYKIINVLRLNWSCRISSEVYNQSVRYFKCCQIETNYLHIQLLHQNYVAKYAVQSQLIIECMILILCVVFSLVMPLFLVNPRGVFIHNHQFSELFPPLAIFTIRQLAFSQS